MSEDHLIQSSLERIYSELPVNNFQRPNIETNEALKQNEEALLHLSTSKMDTIAEGLLGQLNKLQNTQTPTEDAVFRVAQSQVYVLSLFHRCMAFRWEFFRSKYQDVQISDSDENAKIKFKEKQEAVSPPSLNEALISDLFAKLQAFITKPLPVLEDELRQAASQAAFQLSASNYETIFQTLSFCFVTPLSEEETCTNISLFEHLCLNITRLSGLFDRINRNIANFKKSSVQFTLAKALHKVIWNWINNYPMQFVTICQQCAKIPGNADVLFDHFDQWASAGSSSKKQNFWPIQTMLLILCPDVVSRIIRNPERIDKKDKNKDSFIDTLRKSLKNAKLGDIAALCLVNIFKASTYISKADEQGWRFLIADTEDDLKDKLFPKSADNIDEAPLVDYLLSVFYLNSRKTIKALFSELLQPATPLYTKRVFVNTLIRIAKEGETLPWYVTISSIYATHASNLRKLFLEYLQSAKEFSNLKNASESGKKAKAQFEKVQQETEIFQTLIRLYHIDPQLALYPNNKVLSMDVEEITQLLKGLSVCVTLFGLPALVEQATKTLLILHTPENIERWNTKDPLGGYFTISAPVLSSIATVLIEQKEIKQNDIHHLMKLLEELLIARNEFLKRHKEFRVADTGALKTYLQTSSRLEAAFLVNLCSGVSEICSSAVRCIGLMCTEIEILENSIDESYSTIGINFTPFKQLASAGLLSTGRQAQQKNIRTILRRVDRQTQGNFSGWQEAYERWHYYTDAVIYNEERAEAELALSSDAQGAKGRPDKKPKPREAISKRPPPASIPKLLLEKTSQEVLFEWGNHLGLLASLAAVALNQTGPARPKRDTKSSSSSSSSSSSVSSSSSGASVPVVEEFVAELMELMVSDYVNIRETAKGILGSVLSSAAYPILFRNLHSEANKIFGSAGQANFTNNTMLFVDQTLSVIKLILESEHDSEDLSLLKDLEALILLLLRFVRQLALSVNGLQTKHKFSSLLESMMIKHKMISFKNEYSFRTELVENIIEWTSEFSTKESNIPDTIELAVKRQLKKLIKELDVQVMHSISLLLKELPLQGDDDDAKSKSFSKFFTFFTRLLTRCKKEPQSVITPQLPEYTIEALSYLVTANIQHGLEYFVTMGYHEDQETRAAFLRVLTNILKQGTGFDSSENGDKYYKFSELILDPALDVVMALCEVTQVTEADDVAHLLVKIFEANDKTMDLLKVSISQEVQKTDTANTLFRRNSMATKLLAAYCKFMGREYLRTSLGPQLNAIMTQNISLELDETKLPAGQSLEQNQRNMERVCKAFLDDVVASIPVCPAPFREICHFLKTSVAEKFPGSEHTAVAGFMFLRFLCPAIVAPDGYGVIDSTITDKDHRRAFVLITKVLQNLANRVSFTKEPFMNCMNEFIDSNLQWMCAILDNYADLQNCAPPTSINFTDEEKDEDLGRLHWYFSMSQDKALKLLQGKPSQKGPSVHDRLISVLAQLGPPPEPNREKPPTRGPTTPGNRGSVINRQYEKFMSRMVDRDRDTELFKAQDVFFQQGKSKAGQPVFYWIARNFKTDCDNELFIYYILKTIRDFMEKPFVMVIDITGFGKENQLSLQAFTTFSKVLPQQAWDNLAACHILNPNQWFKKYSKTVSKFVSRIQKKFAFAHTVSQIKEFVPEIERGLPSYTINMEKNIQATFSPVTKVTQYNKKELTIQISTDNFHIITQKQHPIFGQSTQLHDIIHISRISEITPNPRDEKEFVLKYDWNGQKSFVLVSPSASQIILQLTASKDRYNLSRPQNALAGRASKKSPSDVPGTLLNMALLNLSASNHALRIAAYNLLVALCNGFSFNVRSILLEAQDIAIPRNSIHFINRISRELAEGEPKLTLDFLLESFDGIAKTEKIGDLQLVLAYIAPWLDNLHLFVAATSEPTSPERILKVKSVINSLVALSIRIANDHGPLNLVWNRIGSQPEAISLVLECMLERAGVHVASKQSPIGMKIMDCLEDIMIALASQNSQIVAGRIIGLLLKTLETMCNSVNERIDAHELWSKVEVLIRWLLTLSFENLISVNQYISELFHIITMTFALGDNIIRATIQGLFMNVIHSIYTSRTCHDEKMQTLKFLLADFHNLASRLHFGVSSIEVTPFSKTERDQKTEKFAILTVENVCNSLLALLNCTTESGNAIGTSSHIRWLSLTSAAAFSNNPAMSSRATVALGVLCQSSALVTEDLISHLLTNLRTALVASAASEQRASDSVVATIHTLSKLFEHISPASKYFKYFFWIAMSIIQLPDQKTFAPGLLLLESVIRSLDQHGCFQGHGISAFAMNTRRGPIEPMLIRLDQLTGLSFDNNFSFAIAGHLLKGVKNSSSKTNSIRLLTAFIELSKESNPANLLGYLTALLPHKSDDSLTLRQVSLAIGEGSSVESPLSAVQLLFNPNVTPDKTHAALLFTFLVTILKSTDLEHEQLFIFRSLEEGIMFMPEAFPVTYDVLLPKISQVVTSSQNRAISDSCLNITKSIFSQGLETSANSAKLTKPFLQTIGFNGLPDTDQFQQSKRQQIIQVLTSLIDTVLNI